MGLDRASALTGGDPGERGPAAGAGDERGYWVVPAESDTTLIAFTGMAKRLDISIYFMQRILGGQGINVIYLFDWADASTWRRARPGADSPRRSLARVLCAPTSRRGA